MKKVSKINANRLKGIRVVDLFAGIGGFHLAFQKYGAKVIYASEWDEKASSIYYDNLKPGQYEYKNGKVFPVKIEYSVLNDRYRICGYEPSGKRFIKMNLYTMRNIRKGEEVFEGLTETYGEFLKQNTRKT